MLPSSGMVSNRPNMPVRRNILLLWVGRTIKNGMFSNANWRVLLPGMVRAYLNGAKSLGDV